MTQTTHIRGPKVSATLLFRRIAPTYASELAQRLHRAGLTNSNDLIMALTTGLNAFSREMGVELAGEFPKAWPEALRELRSARSEAKWEQLLPQTSDAPQAESYILAQGASQMMHVLEASRETAQMSPLVITALGVWVITAVVIAHSGPLDADLGLELLVDCL